MMTAFSEMTSRERVRASVQGEPVDRVPVMYWINPHMACRMMDEMTPAADRGRNRWGRFLWRRFRKRGLDAGEIWRGLPLLLTDYVNAEYALQLGADLALTAAGGNVAHFVQSFRLHQGHLRFKGPWGSERGIGGIYMEVVDPVISDVADLENYRFPEFSDYSAIRKFREDHPDACVVAETYGVQDASFTQLWEMSRMMMAMIDHPAAVKSFFQRFGDWSVEIARKSAESGADVVMIFDDYGSTGRTQISPKMWREFTLPQLRRIIDAIHDSGAMAMLHSCGYVMPLLGDFVDAGLDILQAFQPKAGNDLSEAVDAFGDRLTFATGIDIQQGELMSPEAFRDDIFRQYRIGIQKNRFILATTHNLQYTMPDENTRTLFTTVAEIQRGGM
jgi:uroporphyrinogen decarboxylase